MDLYKPHMSQSDALWAVRADRRYIEADIHRVLKYGCTTRIDFADLYIEGMTPDAAKAAIKADLRYIKHEIRIELTACYRAGLYVKGLSPDQVDSFVDLCTGSLTLFEAAAKIKIDPRYVGAKILGDLKTRHAEDLSDLYVEGMTPREARAAVEADPRYIKEISLLALTWHDGCGPNLTDLYTEGMTGEEALAAARADPRYIEAAAEPSYVKRRILDMLHWPDGAKVVLTELYTEGMSYGEARAAVRVDPQYIKLVSEPSYITWKRVLDLLNTGNGTGVNLGNLYKVGMSYDEACALVRADPRYVKVTAAPSEGTKSPEGAETPKATQATDVE